MVLPRIIALPAGVTQHLHKQMNANAMLDFSMILDYLSVYLVIQTVSPAKAQQRNAFLVQLTQKKALSMCANAKSDSLQTLEMMEF